MSLQLKTLANAAKLLDVDQDTRRVRCLKVSAFAESCTSVSYTHLRAHET